MTTDDPIKNRQQWLAQLAAERVKFWTQVSQAQRSLCFEASKSIIFKTPVDTGTARGNWQANVGSPLRDVLKVTDKNGGPTLSRALKVISKMKPLDTFFLSNNLPYIEALENGHSQRQAPHGMVGVTIAEIEASGAIKTFQNLLASEPGAAP